MVFYLFIYLFDGNYIEGADVWSFIIQQWGCHFLQISNKPSTHWDIWRFNLSFFTLGEHTLLCGNCVWCLFTVK